MVQSDDVPYVDKQAGKLPDDFVAYRNARSVRSWFMLDDEIVVLAAGISDPDGRPLVATVDSRIAAPSDDVVVTGARQDGRAWSGAGSAGLRWLRWANGTEGTAVGYVFLDTPPVTVELADVTRSRRVVRLSNPDTTVTRTVFCASVAYPAGTGDAALAYALVPGASPERLDAYGRTPLRVVANDRRVQAVSHADLGVTAATVFADGWHSAGALSIHGPATVLARRVGRQVSVALSDPTMTRERVRLLLRGRPLRPVSADEGVRVRRVPGGTLVEATTKEVYGATLTATLR